MTLTGKKVGFGFMLILVVISGLILWNNNAVMNEINKIPKTTTCSQITNYNYTYLTPTNEIIYNNSYYTPVRNFQFFPRERNYCANPMDYEVDGQSMFPLVDASKKVLVDRVSWSQLKVGDVIGFTTSGKSGEQRQNIFHAIIYINNEYALTAGYNNDYMDNWKVYPNDVKYRYCEPRDIE